MPQRSDLTFTVDLCPRCGQQHDDLPFDRMRSPIQGATSSFVAMSDGKGATNFQMTEFDLFSTCPTYAEPILARVIDQGEVEVR